MFKTYRFIPCVFILFLFGLTLITVSPVFAEDSPGFIACKQIKPRGNFKLMKQKKNCFRDVARLSQAQSSPAQPVAPIDPSGGAVAQLNNRIAELEGQLSAADRDSQRIIGPLEAKVAELEVQLSAANPSVQSREDHDILDVMTCTTVNLNDPGGVSIYSGSSIERSPTTLPPTLLRWKYLHELGGVVGRILTVCMKSKDRV